MKRLLDIALVHPAFIVMVTNTLAVTYMDVIGMDTPAIQLYLVMVTVLLAEIQPDVAGKVVQVAIAPVLLMVDVAEIHLLVVTKVDAVGAKEDLITATAHLPILAMEILLAVEIKAGVVGNSGSISTFPKIHF